MDGERRMAERRRGVPDLASAVAVLDEHVTTMTAEASMLRREVSHQRDRSMVLGFVVGAMVLVGIIVFVIGLTNSSTLQQINRTQEYLVQCTTPGPQTPTASDPSTGHDCFDASLRRTAEAVDKIIEGVRAP